MLVYLRISWPILAARGVRHRPHRAALLKPLSFPTTSLIACEHAVSTAAGVTLLLAYIRLPPSGATPDFARRRRHMVCVLRTIAPCSTGFFDVTFVCVCLFAYLRSTTRHVRRRREVRRRYTLIWYAYVTNE